MSNEEEHEAQIQWDTYRSGFCEGYKKAMLKWKACRENGMNELDSYNALADYFNNEVYSWKEQSYDDVRWGKEDQLPHP